MDSQNKKPQEELGDNASGEADKAVDESPATAEAPTDAPSLAKATDDKKAMAGKQSLSSENSDLPSSEAGNPESQNTNKSDIQGSEGSETELKKPVASSDKPEEDAADDKEASETEEVSVKESEKKEETQAPEEKPKDEEIERAKKILSEDDLDDPAKWYIVHTYSGHENKVAKSIKQRIQSLGYENRIFDIIVPTRNTIKVSQGKKENVKEKIFPGYVLIKMILDNETWLLIRTTQGVTSFIGSGNKPIPISKQEVSAIMRFMEEEEPLYKTSYVIGEAVKIVDGPFADFLGTIDSIDEARGKVKVLVSIFGRETPVELDFLQVNKL